MEINRDALTGDLETRVQALLGEAFPEGSSTNGDYYAFHGVPDRILIACEARQVVGHLALYQRQVKMVDEVLEMVALVCEEDAAPAAARLLGAAGARSDRRGRVLSNEVNGCYDRLAKTLGPDAFAEHEAAGRSLSAGEALSFALTELQTHAVARTEPRNE